MLEVKVVRFYDQDFSLVVCNPFFVPVVQIAEVLDAYALFLIPASLLDLRNQGWNR